MPARGPQRFGLGQQVARDGWIRGVPPAAIGSALIIYAVLLCVGIWGVAISGIQSDYRSTVETERRHLRSVTGTLEAQIEAMLGDGVGAARRRE
jgi:hypothetical protein